MKIHWSQKIFYYWLVIVSLCFIVQSVAPEYNMGILMAILFVPILIHDILVNLFKEKK